MVKSITSVAYPDTNEGEITEEETKDRIPEVITDGINEGPNGEDPTENWLRKEAKRLGLNSEKYASGGALYFYSPEFTSSSELVARSNIKCKVQKGGHIFYKVWG